jgi:Skp family chaperone for outer membrane proteins
MKISLFGAAAALVLATTLSLPAQDKPAALGRTGLLNMRDLLDKAKNPWIVDIDQEMQKITDTDAGRSTDVNPLERSRVRNKILETGNRRRMELYGEIVRISGEVARERGFDLIQRLDRMPVHEGPESDVLGQIDRRAIVYYDPALDITPTVMERLLKEFATRKK